LTSTFRLGAKQLIPMAYVWNGNDAMPSTIAVV
jgi:hypothetical protein